MGKYLWKARHYTDPTCFGSDDDIVRSAREAQMDLADGSVSTIKSNVNPKKRRRPSSRTPGPSIHNGAHHYTPGSPTVTVERAGAVVCKRATPIEPGGATPEWRVDGVRLKRRPAPRVAPPPPWRTFAVCHRAERRPSAAVDAVDSVVGGPRRPTDSPQRRPLAFRSQNRSAADAVARHPGRSDCATAVAAPALLRR